MPRRRRPRKEPASTRTPPDRRWTADARRFHEHPPARATTTRAGENCRSATIPASIVDPVASPSSTRRTVRPSTLAAARPARYKGASRRSSSRRSLTAHLRDERVRDAEFANHVAVENLNPPEAMAPITSANNPTNRQAWWSSLISLCIIQSKVVPRVISLQWPRDAVSAGESRLQQQSF